MDYPLGKRGLGDTFRVDGGTLPFRFWGWDKGLGTPLGLMGGDMLGTYTL